MFKKIDFFGKTLFIFLSTAISLFSFQSEYLPSYNTDIHCDKILHKKAFDICYSCKWKIPKLVVYQIDGYLADSKNFSRKHKKISVITGVCGSTGKLINNVNVPEYWYKISAILKLGEIDEHRKTV